MKLAGVEETSDRLAAPMCAASRDTTARDVFTVFAIPKAFVGHTAVIQTNALKSWTLLSPRPDIIVFGDEEGAESVCQELGIRQEKDIARNEFGTPMVNDLFARAHALARTEILCYANSDIIFFHDLPRAIGNILRWAGERPFLTIGRRWDLPVDEPLKDQELTPSLSHRARTEGEAGNDFSLDYFVYRKGQYRSLPPFAVGRVWWDNWMVYEARNKGFPVIDLSHAVTPIHQRHGHTHIQGGEGAFLSGVEAKRNQQLMRSVFPLPVTPFNLLDATHVLTSAGLRRSWRDRGMYRWARSEVGRNRVALFHPWVRPYLGAARRLKARLARST